MNKVKTVKMLRVIMPLIALTCLIVFPPWEVVWAWMRPLPETVQEQVDETIGYGFDGMIVHVDKEGQDPEWYVGGWKNREEKIPADPNALFKIASIGKLYDAMAVTRLVNRGRLSLDKSLAEYFPELKDRIQNAEKITLRMMVQHRSGIPNLTDTPNFWTDPPKDADDAVERILDLPAEFMPDEKYSYSNSNYMLIARLVEKETGVSIFQYIKAAILDPLGLKNTYGSINEVNMEDVMSGYYVGIDEDIKSTDYGSMLATAEDVGIFLRALNDGSIFMGREKDIYSSIYVFDHTGLIPGYQSIARYHEDLDAVVVQFVNTTNFSDNTWTLSEVAYDRIINILKK
jgi:CubicO group peptidase (beta-lactamase class C family)